MSDTQTAPPATEPTPTAPAAAPAAPSLDQLAAALGDAEKGGKSKATGELLKITGFDKLSDLQDFVKNAKAAEDDKKDALTRAQETAVAARADADRARAEADELRHYTRLERALVIKGAPAEHVDKLRRMLDVAPDAEDGDVAKAVDGLADQFPPLFSPIVKEEKPAPSGVTGSQAPQGGQGSVSPIAAGRERYYAEHPEARPKSA